MAFVPNPLSSSGNFHKTCWNPDCSNENSVTKRCSRCRQAMYCDVGCQKSHWPQHKSVCQLPDQSDVPRLLGEIQRYASLDEMIASGSSLTLNIARKCANQDQMIEAAGFISFMLPGDQNTFLQEMRENSKWKTVDIAIMLGLLGKMKEAMEIMEGFPSESDRQRFLAGVVPITGSIFDRYKEQIIITGKR